MAAELSLGVGNFLVVHTMAAQINLCEACKMTTAHDADATIQFRMNSTIKEGAFAVLREMGISPSEVLTPTEN